MVCASMAQRVTMVIHVVMAKSVSMESAELFRRNADRTNHAPVVCSAESKHAFPLKSRVRRRTTVVAVVSA